MKVKLGVTTCDHCLQPLDGTVFVTMRGQATETGKDVEVELEEAVAVMCDICDGKLNAGMGKEGA